MTTTKKSNGLFGINGRMSMTKIGGAMMGAGQLLGSGAFLAAFPVAGAWAPLVGQLLLGLGTVVGANGLRNAMAEGK